MCFLPWFAATPSRDIRPGDRHWSFARLPPGVLPGMSALIDGPEGKNSWGDSRSLVREIRPDGVTVGVGLYDYATTVRAGEDWVLFRPAVRSGEFMTRDPYLPGLGCDMIAAECEFRTPGTGTAPALIGADFGSIDQREAFGAWSDIWLMSQPGIPGSGKRRTYAEMDLFEQTIGFRGAGDCIGNGFAGDPDLAWDEQSGSWRNEIFSRFTFDQYHLTRLGTALNTQFVKMGFVWSRDQMAVFLNGMLMRQVTWRWTSDYPSTLITSLQVGSSSRTYGSLMVHPFHDDNFKHMQLRLRSMRILKA
jgi:hypothetical protein